MAVARAHSVALLGIDGAIVEIEADISSGLPATVLVGLPDTALGEAQHRVRAAALNSGCPLTRQRLTINLSPAALPKHGTAFDLGIALAAFAADGVVDAASVAAIVHLGELGLDGRVRPIAGVLPAVLAAFRAGFDTVMVPVGNAAEAALVPGVRVIGVASLTEAAIWHGADLDPVEVEAIVPGEARAVEADAPDLSEVVGNDDAIEAMLVAATGGHHMFLLGPPGAGKTMLAARLPGILPQLDTDAALEVSSLRSLAGEPLTGALPVRPPLEAPHHTATAVALVGGGSRIIRPGAAARASHGVLFLDEAAEFSAVALDALRQPLESRRITIHRANAVASFPAKFQLLLAANPCPCGQYGAPDADCDCAPFARRRYLARLSGPLLDRVDLQLRVPRVTAAQLKASAGADRLTSAAARSRVARAREASKARLAGTPWCTNAEVAGSWLRDGKHRLPASVTAPLDRALERGAISMRGFDRVLRVAWSIADLAGADRPTSDHLGRALYFRKAIAA